MKSALHQDRINFPARHFPVEVYFLSKAVIQPDLFACIRQEGHVACPFDGFGNGMLRNGGAARFSAADDLSMAIDQLFQQLHVFVIHVHRTRPFAVDSQGVLFLGARANFLAFFGSYRKCHSASLSEGFLTGKFQTEYGGNGRIAAVSASVASRDCTECFPARKVRPDTLREGPNACSTLARQLRWFRCLRFLRRNRYFRWTNLRRFRDRSESE